MENILKKIVCYIFAFSLLQSISIAQWIHVDGPSGSALCFTEYFYWVEDTGTFYSFIGTEGAGIFASTDDGNTWAPANNGLPSTATVRRFLLIPEEGIFAGTSEGVFHSLDNGTTWTAINGGLTYKNVNDLAFSDLDFLAGSVGVFFSSYQSGIWTSISTGLPNIEVNAIIASNTNLFAGTAGSGVFISTDKGDNWSATSLTNCNVSSLKSLYGILYAGTDNGLYMSSDNGTSWHSILNSAITCLDLSDLCFFAGTNNGIFLSTDYGTSWNDISGELPNTGIKSIYSYGGRIGGQYIYIGNSSSGYWKRLISDIITSISPPKIEISQQYLNFGTVGLGLTKIDTLNIMNSGVNILKIDSAYTGTQWFTVTPQKDSVEKAEALNLYISFTPDTLTTYLDTLYIKNNSETHLVKIPLNGYLELPQVVFNKTNIDFGQVISGSIKTDTLKITNGSYTPLVIDSVYTDTKCFVVASQKTILTKSDTLQLSVSFAPDSINTYSGLLYIKSNSTSILTTIPLKGYLAVPSIVVKHNSINFGSVLADSTYTDTLIITNNSIAPLIIDSIYSGTQWFSVISQSITITHLDTLLLPVFLRPDTLKQYSDTLYIKSNSGIGLTKIILKGELAIPEIVTDQNIIDFGECISQSVNIEELLITDNSIASLIIDTIYTGTRWFTITSQKDTLTKSDTLRLLISFIPDTLRTYLDTLYIKSNARTQLTKIYLSGELAVSEIILNKNIVDFGNILLNSTITDTLIITNNSIAPLIIDSVYTGTRWFTAIAKKDTVANNDILKLCISFTPDTSKMYSDTLYIVNNSDVYLMKIPLNGNAGLPHITLSRTSISFSSVQFGSIKTDTLTITNDAFTPLIIDSIYTGTKWFSVIPSKDTLTLSESIELTVSFTPDSLKPYSDTLYILNNSDIPFAKIVLYGNGALTEVAQNKSEIPVSFGISQNYPNPFNPTTTIGYQLPINCHIEIKIFDILGKEVCVLFRGVQKTGYYNITFNAKHLPSGVYFYRLLTPSFTQTKKFLLIK